MLCIRPFVKAGVAHGCGQCKPCRIARRKLWTHRIMLEGMCHIEKAFVTLTYDNSSLPLVDTLPIRGTLVKKHLQDWLKVFRRRIEPIRVRYYAVGEYGADEFVNGHYGRPHYHLVLFGFASCVRGSTLRNPVTGESRWKECCDICRLYGETWGKGSILLGTVTRDSASYCAEYTVKKMTASDDRRLHGRAPEFCTMSLRPGIGAEYMWEVASALMKNALDEVLDDVPVSLGSGRRKLPLGRYLRRKLRVMIGKDGDTPEIVLQKMAEEMRPLREAAFNASSSFAKAIVEDGNQVRLNIDGMEAIYKSVRRLK
ncbi:MAG: replication initiator protein [Microvirus sp.]|nr:MAG: replication initiator protein [Microvirus sp.]